MNGAQHYRAAENLIASVNKKLGDGGGFLFPPEAQARLLAEALVHATLANAAATALNRPDGLPGDDWKAWYAAASVAKS
jgi:hypothetical protein